MSATVRLRVVAVRPETNDVKTFVMRPEGGPVAFLAGQSITFTFEVGGEMLHRTFSIASAPGHGDMIELTIKVHPGGRVTNWIHRKLAVGDLVNGQAPRGNFSVVNRSTDQLAFVSAGSGASPLMSMLRHLADVSREADVAWLHWARRPSDALFADELARHQTAMPGLKVSMAVTSLQPGWFGYSGRPDRRQISAMSPDFGQREVFCCGPSGFMDAVRAIHAAEGGVRERFNVEYFGAAPMPELPRVVAHAGEFTVRYAGKSFAARGDETILAAAARQNVVIQCGCASGICGTCRLRLAAGEVDMRHNGGISVDEEGEGFILACSARPMSDIVLEP